MLKKTFKNLFLNLNGCDSEPKVVAKVDEGGVCEPGNPEYVEGSYRVKKGYNNPCKTDLYCNPDTKKCVKQIENNGTCKGDWMCKYGRCERPLLTDPSGTCTFDTN